LLERELMNDNLKEYTRIIIGEADRLRNLVDRMLGPSTIPVKRDTNIHEVLERVRSLVLVEAGEELRITRDYDPSIPLFKTDTEQLIQAILNIVKNAVRAVNRKGTIVMKTRVERQFTIGNTRHRLVARIDIIDDGIGIADDMIENIFYPMVTGFEGGTGLGLSIAQSTINQYGGLIECESRPGKTVFTVLLPLEVDDDS
jgi:two-component system, NtrC family, nitrogen regulation sensor histidine kinase GlnL